MSAVTDFIKAAVKDNPIDCEAAFDAMMEPKIADAVSQGQKEYTTDLFNKKQQEDE